jgi:hypothetical protein
VLPHTEYSRAPNGSPASLTYCPTWTLDRSGRRILGDISLHRTALRHRPRRPAFITTQIHDHPDRQHGFDGGLPLAFKAERLVLRRGRL